MSDLNKLLQKGVLGFYDMVEVTEIFGIMPDKTIVNIFTIIVAEERKGHENQLKKLINEKRITIPKLKNWSFGILRYSKTIREFINDINLLREDKTWTSSSGNLEIQDDLVYKPPIFVAPNSFDEIPINKILKNNFWNGSYVLELQNSTKTDLLMLFNNPRLLQDLSEKIQNYVPISIASVSDKLGNYLLQIPITVIQARIVHSKEENNLLVKVAYHSSAEQRRLRVNCEMEHDNAITGYGSYEVNDSTTLIPMDSDKGPHKGIIWDDDNKLILAAVRQSSFVNSFVIGMGILDNEPRYYKTKINDLEEEVRIKIQNNNKHVIGDKPINIDVWEDKRLYRDEKNKLKSQKKFVQYKPDKNHQKTEHNKAILDIQTLICKYGEQGVWLWDPYLDSKDILETLFHCPFSGSDLKALTNLSTFNDCTDEEKNKISKTKQLNSQRTFFNNLESNFRGMKLEFRARIGMSGWDFHDRFIIFPDTEVGTLAWSLGTSINSFGNTHHILQQVDDGQLIGDSFMDLWEQLDEEDNLIWKI